ncbi:MAG TPA: hypothetical protein DD706_02015, partial [Nitrospiraceae bacterium]|nr:hypothetical protein [Nitrospiraceae bacterium]
AYGYASQGEDHSQKNSRTGRHAVTQHPHEKSLAQETDCRWFSYYNVRKEKPPFGLLDADKNHPPPAQQIRKRPGMLKKPEKGMWDKKTFHNSCSEKLPHHTGRVVRDGRAG